ncbi:hypothetical protein HOY34_13555 [Xinfangfangia sp. D13-10-4-6]|uniref:hypothetical protein n=1 Tax=Pseudogemmobacter hezensis TaxID=2737662 RepID=UPI00155452BA|nr:hypothetical protein [Pseudogemmobacter hezensis]NPD16222.1 hypothetical protein [Pseudogemmobacter hezensis]
MTLSLPAIATVTRRGTRRSTRRGILAALLLSTPMMAFAENARPDSVDLGGHIVTVTETEDFDQAVVVDGEPILTNGLIFLDGTVEVAGQTVVTGVAGSGGNACGGTPFVISLADGVPKLDGPIESCSWFEMTASPDQLLFQTGAYPGLPAQVYSWTPASGLVDQGPKAFAPIEGQTWADFAWLAGKHPSDALGFAPVYAEFTSSMSASDWDEYAGILVQMGSGDLIDQGYSGNACNKLACLSEWAWLWIDKDSQQAVAVWKNEGDEEPKSWPADRSTWPEWIQHAASEAIEGGN